MIDDHVSDVRLQAYLDDEVPPEERQRIATHLARCPRCAESVRQWEAVRALVQCARPEEECFSSAGEFWGRLAARLPARRPDVWPWITYLPPVLFSLAAVSLGMAATLLLGLADLVEWGLLPAVSTGQAQQAATTAAQWLWRYTMLSWFSPGERALDALQSLLARLSGDDLHQWILGGLLAALAIAWVAVAILYLWWFVCWRGTQVAGAKRR